VIHTWRDFEFAVPSHTVIPTTLDRKQDAEKDPTLK
jgi:hypothetical protein